MAVNRFIGHGGPGQFAQCGHEIGQVNEVVAYRIGIDFPGQRMMTIFGGWFSCSYACVNSPAYNTNTQQHSISVLIMFLTINWSLLSNRRELVL